jgi:hypothetical protein
MGDWEMKFDHVFKLLENKLTHHRMQANQLLAEAEAYERLGKVQDTERLTRLAIKHIKVINEINAATMILGSNENV